MARSDQRLAAYISRHVPKSELVFLECAFDTLADEDEVILARAISKIKQTKREYMVGLLLSPITFGLALIWLGFQGVSQAWKEHGDMIRYLRKSNKNHLDSVYERDIYIERRF